MKATAESSALWDLTWGNPHIDPDELLQAIEKELADTGRALDVRTKLLIRDSARALQSYWGRGEWDRRLERSPAKEAITEMVNAAPEEKGFPTLRRRIMAATRPEVIERFLRDLGLGVNKPVTIYIAGSASLILTHHLLRQTDDIDVVNEVPPVIRERQELLDQLQARYGLAVGHVQSHYLPTGWESRVKSLGSFGTIQVYLVDAMDIFLSKLCSRREKDREDLNSLAPQLEKEAIAARLPTVRVLLEDHHERSQADHNWYVLYGEQLPWPAPPGQEKRQPGNSIDKEARS